MLGDLGTMKQPLNTSILSTPIERDATSMKLPDLPSGKCVNHPDRKSVRKHLCSECLANWEKTVLSYEAIEQGEVLVPE